ncbi:hypothetical protein BGZ94_002322 [Podila epigama]|nr:hypothetical protein BGZ94_002322 [Podila epigama]
MVPGRSNKKEKKKRFASLKRTGTLLKRALSGSTIVNVETRSSSTPPSPTSTVATVVASSTITTSPTSDSLDRSNSVKSIAETLHEIHENNTDIDITQGCADPKVGTSKSSPCGKVMKHPYHEQALPTFETASADTVSRRLATLDLLTSAVLVFVPLAFYYGLRTVAWEGAPAWCPETKSRDWWTIFICQWVYSMVPGVVHAVVMLALGYLGIYLARKTYQRYQKRGGADNIEAALPYPDVNCDDEQLSVEDGNWDEGDVVYSRGRVDIKKAIQGFVEAGVGNKEKSQGLVTVFAGGPEGYLDMVEKHVRNAPWTVQFRRETWAP